MCHCGWRRENRAAYFADKHPLSQQKRTNHLETCCVTLSCFREIFPNKCMKTPPRWLLIYVAAFFCRLLHCDRADAFIGFGAEPPRSWKSHHLKRVAVEGWSGADESSFWLTQRPGWWHAVHARWWRLYPKFLAVIWLHTCFKKGEPLNLTMAPLKTATVSKGEQIISHCVWACFKEKWLQREHHFTWCDIKDMT